MLRSGVRLLPTAARPTRTPARSLYCRSHRTVCSRDAMAPTHRCARAWHRTSELGVPRGRSDVFVSSKRHFGTSRPTQQSMATPPFQRLVDALKSTNQTCTIVESSCGGLLSSSLMSVPGSSKVYFGGTVAYNTKKSGRLLCGDDGLHRRLVDISTSRADTDTGDVDDGALDMGQDLSEETRRYIRAKVEWTRETALAYCDHMGTDFAIAEGGATGPTFRPKGMERGFAVLAVAGRKSKGGEIELLAQTVCHSSHADRERNMRLFADTAAELCLEAMGAGDHSIPNSEAMSGESNGGAGGLFLDRSSHIRNTPEMEELYQRQDALHVILRGTNEGLFASPNELALPSLQSMLTDRAFEASLEQSNANVEELMRERVFLGRLGASQTPVFTVFLPKDASYENSDRGHYFASTRPHAPKLIPVHNELALTATAYANWQDTHQYCCVCGSPLEYIHGGTCAKCTASNGKPHHHWPRQDPSIIVLVASQTHALLARSPRHPSYLYTALAGFIEAGETIESATAREVHEEVGVDIDMNSIDYVASQPWPFPRSYMIGMSARPSSELAPFHIDPNEIVDAEWYEKETVYQAARDSDAMGAVLDRQVVEERQAKGEWTGKLLVPSKGILARTLIDNWLEKG